MLPSPIIEGTLPAFYANDLGVANIAIPFFMSRAVNQNQVDGFIIKIKNLQGSEYILSERTDSLNDIDFNTGIVNFRVSADIFKIGSFYKVQLAYIEKDKNRTEGYYSTVGIIKYTTKPDVFIEGLSNNYNSHIYNYTGVYNQKEKDATEKVYSYRFLLEDEDNNIVKDTGFLIHNSSNDIEYYSSQDIITIPEDLDENKKYFITYTVKTNNGLEISSPMYKITAKSLIPSNLQFHLETALNYDNGYIQIALIGDKNDDGMEIPIRGSFVLSRSTEEGEFKDWKEISKFSLSAQRLSQRIIKDFSIEQGIKYQYSIQQFNDKVYSERVLSDIIEANFEDCFLYDGRKQLKIKFNPKISSFKKDLFEAKMDTLGSKYPFFFKNGQVEYKEFPISGLISYLSDEENLFLDNSELFKDIYRTNNKHNLLSQVQVKPEKETYLKFYLTYSIKLSKIILDDNNRKKVINEYIKWTDFIKQNYSDLDYLNWEQIKDIFYKMYLEEKLYENRYKQKEQNYDLKTTNLLSYNIQKEREFKLAVLDWLTNGEPKLFKSPTEGNYLVRLMNISLSPQDQLGRMLHNFQATAYEIGDTSYDTLVSYGIINSQNYNKSTLKIMSIPLYTKDKNLVDLNPSIYLTQKDNGWYATGLLKYGSQLERFELYDMDPGTLIVVNQNNGESDIIMIGASGSYIAQTPVSSIQLAEGQLSKGIATISYYTNFIGSFSQISGIETEERIGQQFIGEHENIINEIEDIQKVITNLYDIKVYKRDVKTCSFKEDYVPVEKGAVNSQNYKQYYLKNGENDYILATSNNQRLTYYRKIKIIQDSNKNLLLAYSLIPVENNKIIEQSSNFNALDLYSYSLLEDELLGKLYKRVSFKDIGHQDSLRLQNRDLSNRSASNPYLYDFRDFELMVSKGILYEYKDNDFIQVINPKINIAQAYFIIKPIDYIYDIYFNKIYLDNSTYADFISLINFLKGQNIQNSNILKEKLETFNEYCCKIIIEGNEIDISQTGYYSTGSIGKISSLTSTVGVYCELYYQNQIIQYDLTNQSSLQSDLMALNASKVTLKSKPTVANENDYIKEIELARNNYYNNYNNYVKHLQTYLDLLNREQGGN